MFGQNPVEPLLKTHDGSTLEVKDVFSTLQGEGPYAGRPAVFVRLAGCHLRCYFCDTDFLSGRMHWDLQTLLADVLAREKRLVVLTGGEPMRQNVVPFCELLVGKGIQVQIETAGSFWPQGEFGDRFENLVAATEVTIVVSPKTPRVHEGIAAYAEAWKYIITQSGALGADGLPDTSTQQDGTDRPLARPPEGTDPENIWLQPCDVYDPGVNISTQKRVVALCQKHGYRLSLQQHKIVGLP